MAFLKNLRGFQNGDVKKNSKVTATVIATTVVAAGAYGAIGSKTYADALQKESIQKDDEESKSGGMKEVLSMTIDGIFGTTDLDYDDDDDVSVTNDSEDYDQDDYSNDDGGIKEVLSVAIDGIFGTTDLDEEEEDEEPSWMDEAVDLVFSGLSIKKRTLEDFEDEDDVDVVVEEEGDSSDNESEKVSTKSQDSKSTRVSTKSQDSKSTRVSTKSEKELIKIAKSYLNRGITYKMGGKNTVKLDCSGYVSLVFKDMGLSINEFMVNAGKFRQDSTKINREDMKPGDLVFWHDKTGRKHAKVFHIGLFVGDDTIVDCSTDHNGVGTRKLSSLKDNDTRYYTFGRYEKLQKVLNAN